MAARSLRIVFAPRLVAPSHSLVFNPLHPMRRALTIDGPVDRIRINAPLPYHLTVQTFPTASWRRSGGETAEVSSRLFRLQLNTCTESEHRMRKCAPTPLTMLAPAQAREEENRGSAAPASCSQALQRSRIRNVARACHFKLHRLRTRA